MQDADLGALLILLWSDSEYEFEYEFGVRLSLGAVRLVAYECTLFSLASFRFFAAARCAPLSACTPCLRTLSIPLQSSLSTTLITLR